MKSAVSGVGVVDKAATILGVLQEAGPLNLGQLVDRTGLSRATVHRLAQALAVQELIARDREGRFVLGPRLIELGSAAATMGPSLEEASRPALEALRDATGESVQLYVPAGESRVCIASLQSPHGLRTIVALGAKLPMDKGSAGKVLSGRASGGARPGQTWAESVEEREKGVASVSAPVRRDGKVVAAVSVSGPVQRLTRSPGQLYAKAVINAARTIEDACGWSTSGARHLIATPLIRDE